MPKINFKKPMETTTKTATKVVSNTALIVATFVAFGAGMIAFAAAPVTKAVTSGSSNNKVYSCRSAKNGVTIRTSAKVRSTALINGCKTTNKVKKSYTYTCVSNKLYKKAWGPCVPKVTTILPDLIVKDFSFTAADAGYGPNARLVNITIKNIGTAKATSTSAIGFTVQSYGIKADGTVVEGEMYDTLNTPTLTEINSDQEVSFSFPSDIPSSGLADAVKVKMVADMSFGQSYLKESNEDNNELTKDFSFTATEEGLSDLVIEDVKFTADYGELTLNVVKGTAASPEITVDANASPADESGLRVIWQDADGKQLSAFGSYLVALKPGEKKAFTISAAGGNTVKLNHIVIFVDKTNKVKEIIEEDNNAFVEELKVPLVVANCVDSDAKTFSDLNQLFIKSTTKVKGVDQKADVCVGNYVFEGACNKDVFVVWHKNCAELNGSKSTNDYKCVEGICVNKYVDPTVVLSDLDLVFRNIGTNGGIEIPVAASPKVVRAVYGFDGSTTNAKLNVPKDTNIFPAYFINAGNVYVQNGVKISFLDEGKNELGSYLVDLDATAAAKASSINLPNNPDIKFVRVYLDVDNKIAETNENNNVSERAVDPSLFSLPDITFSGAIAIPTSANPKIVQAFYTNSGTADSVWTRNGVKFSFLDVNKNEIASLLANMDVVSANNLQTKVAAVNLPVIPEIKYIRVYLDAFADNYESNEANNVLERAI